MARKAFWIVTCASALALVSGSNAMAGASVPVLVSGPSTSTCTAAQDSAQPGQIFANAEVEPQTAVFGDHVIAMWHQDRWSNGGAHGIGVGASNNGGATWTDAGMPWSVCETGTPSSLNYFRNSDPWVSFGHDGTAYASALAFNLGFPNNANAVAAATSSDFGLHWTNVQPIPGSIFTQTAQGTDKNSTTADPKTDGVAYTVWDTLLLPTDNPDDNPHTSSYTGPTYFSMTTDHGATWSNAKIIVDTKQRQQTIGNIIVVDTRTNPHTLYNFMNLIISPNTPRQGTRSNQQLAFVKSTDGGTTWSAPQIIGPFNSLGVHDPNTGAPLRTGDGLEEVAIDPASGQLFVVWQSSSAYQKQLKQSGAAFDDTINITTSTDGGGTWSAPVTIEHIDGVPSFTPTIAVNGSTLAVTYYDTRNLVAGQTDRLPTDYWVKYSTDGGAHWGSEQHITGSFDSMTAPVARGFFLGDYEALQPSGAGFKAVFVKTNCDAPYAATNPLCAPASSNVATTSNNNPTDVFIANLSLT